LVARNTEKNLFGERENHLMTEIGILSVSEYEKMTMG